MARRREPSQATFLAEHRRWCVRCNDSGLRYADTTLTCRRCGVDFVFTAEQQRYWYAELKLWDAAKPPRLCPSCGRARRTGRERHNRLTEATRRSRERPDDPDALLGLAAATADHVAHHGRGSAGQGVAAARRARQLDPDLVEAYFWEGACHDAAGRPGRAVDCYQRFVTEAAGVRRLHGLAGRAGDRIHELRTDLAGPAPSRGDAD